MREQLTTVYKHDPNIVSRNIAGEVILVPIRSNLADMNYIFNLNETAARFWELTDGTRSLAQVHQLILAEFNVEAAQLEADLLELVEGLIEANALVSVSG